MVTKDCPLHQTRVESPTQEALGVNRGLRGNDRRFFIEKERGGLPSWPSQKQAPPGKTERGEASGEAFDDEDSEQDAGYQVDLNLDADRGLLHEIAPGPWPRNLTVACSCQVGTDKPPFSWSTGPPPGVRTPFGGPAWYRFRKCIRKSGCPGRMRSAGEDCPITSRGLAGAASR